MQTHQLTRGSLANKTGVNAETIRYYEKAGVVPDPAEWPIIEALWQTIPEPCL